MRSVKRFVRDHQRSSRRSNAIMARVRNLRTRRVKKLVRKYISHGNKPLKVKPIPKDAPQPNTAWYHPKSGAIVIVFGTGRHTETGEFLVHYTYKGDLWSRPLSMWGDQVRHTKAKTTFARFIQIKSTPPLFTR